MITTPNPVTYQELLSKHERIRIPRLQRDYAQGRKGAKETNVRDAFLEVIRTALARVEETNFTPLNLDFVYGSAEDVPFRHFSPLDGQQRLTTLFLLHWLLAWRDGDDCWKQFTETFREKNGRSRFSYDVRTSSGEFFDALVSHRPPTDAQSPGFDLRNWITDQPWYFQYWRLDPTVQGVLEMLQAMHQHALFKLHPGALYRLLTDPARPAITFQLLDLGQFPLSDDLYIKMNARGKPLTAFETFKARYETNLASHFSPLEKRTIGTASFAMPEFVSRRLDTAWTDFFWTHHRSADSFVPQRVDESFMNLFRAIALVTREPSNAAETYKKEVDTLVSAENPPTYSAFAAHQWLDREFSTLFVALMESWCQAGLPLSSVGIFDEKQLLSQLFEDFAKLTVPQVVLFCGYALFVREYEQQIQAAELSEWMRIVHNLAYNSEIDRTERVQNAVKGLRELLPHARSILTHVANAGRQASIPGFYADQQREEALKAGLLLADPAGWRPLIDRAERHGYFRGQIGFLLCFAGVKAEWEKTGDCAWPAADHNRFQVAFETYLAKAEAMFGANGLIDLGAERWQRALLSFGDYLLPNGANYSFLVNDASEAFSWKRLLRNDDVKRDLVRKLWDHSDYKAPFAAGLDSIIQAATGLDPWREALVRNSGAVSYCRGRNIQRNGGNYVLLLSRKKRSAPHVELFTHLLYPLLQPPASLFKGEYHDRVEPHIPLSFSWRGEQRTLELRGGDGTFQLWLKLPVAAELLSLLVQQGQFAPAGLPPDEWIMRDVARADLDRSLQEIASLLTAP